MVWRFDPAGVKAVGLQNTNAGDFICPLRSGQRSELWLRLAGDAPHSPIVHLTGPHALEVWFVEPRQPLPTLLVAEGPKLQLEVADNQSIGNSGAGVGSLIVADSGAYFMAKSNNQGFMDECCISLASWSVVAPHEVENIRASFPAWRLVDSGQPNDKRIVLTFGDWGAAA